jgi:hypothetical protein
MTSVVKLPSQRPAWNKGDVRRIFCCNNCGSYSFRIVEEGGETDVYCANCENWIQEVTVTVDET